MTTQHTPGRLKVQRPYAGERGWEIAFEPGLEQVCQNVTEANARRLVAAWNVTIGIPTEMLEAASNAEKVEPTWQDQKDQIDELITALAACRDAMPPSSVDISEAVGYPTSVSAYVSESVALLVAQRDELLEALKHIEGVAMADEWRDLPEIAKHARAAIAKAEGGEA